MRAIAHDFFQQSPVMAAPLVAMLLFLVVFLLIIVRTFATRRDAFDSAAKMPLVDGEASSSAQELRHDKENGHVGA